MTRRRGRKGISDRIQRWFLLLFSPLIIAIIAGVSIAFGTRQPITWWTWLMCGTLGFVWALLYAASYTTLFRRPLAYLATVRRSRRFKKPRVLVLDGRLEFGKPANVRPYATDLRPDDWRRKLAAENPRWRVRCGPLNSIHEDQFEILLNPFGEVYPEENFTLHTTLQELTDWVRSGGVYVNVAGYPFFWQHNPTTGETAAAGRWDLQVDSNGKLGRADLKPLLGDTLLGINPEMELGSRLEVTCQQQQERTRFGEIAGAGGSAKVVVYRTFPSSIQCMIPILRCSSEEYIAIGAVSYGLGFFFFCSFLLKGEGTAFEKVVAAIKGWAKYESEGRRP